MQAAPRPLLERGWRYSLIGFLCAVLNYVVMLTVDFAGGHYLLGTLTAFFIVTPIGYALHSWFTFSEPFRLSALLRFGAAVAATYPVATAMLAVLCSGFGLSVAIAIPAATVALFVWNFVAAHRTILPRVPITAGAAAARSSDRAGHWRW
jgi:putative flippase GtrA